MFGNAGGFGAESLGGHGAIVGLEADEECLIAHSPGDLFGGPAGRAWIAAGRGFIADGFQRLGTGGTLGVRTLRRADFDAQRGFAAGGLTEEFATGRGHGDANIAAQCAGGGRGIQPRAAIGRRGANGERDEEQNRKR